MNLETTVLFESDVRIVRDRVIFRLYRQPRSPCLLERRVVMRDVISDTQIVAVTDADTLQKVIATDPYSDHLRTQYEAVVSVHSEHANDALVLGHRPWRAKAIDEIGEIRGCANEAELMILVDRVVGRLGGQSYVYRWVKTEDRTGAVAEHRCLIGCDPGWMHEYMRRQWYRKDPFVEHAKRIGGPAIGQSIAAASESPWSKDIETRYGFRSIFASSAHRPSNVLIGLLQIGNELPQDEGEPKLWQHRILLRALCDEILDWRIATNRKEEGQRANLDDRERIVLRLLRSGRTVRNVADTLGFSERTAYVIFGKINEKLGVSHIARAVEIAVTRSLIE